MTGSFHKLDPGMEGADTYLEIGAALHVHVRIAREDWSPYDLANDRSIRPGTSYEDWKKADVFVNGSKAV